MKTRKVTREKLARGAVRAALSLCARTIDEILPAVGGLGLGRYGRRPGLRLLIMRMECEGVICHRTDRLGTTYYDLLTQPLGPAPDLPERREDGHDLD